MMRPLFFTETTTMELQALLDELFAMTFVGIKPGLERIEVLCASVGDPQDTYPVIHVAGTNGKGSLCAMIAAVLQGAGLKVGLYTSPHIECFNERIRVNGVQIADVDVARLARPLMDAATAIQGTFFEVTTAMAFQYFAEQRVDVAVIETGLGGRLDATNIVSPMLTAITSIDFDHMEYLGSTLESIASEKAGIIKSGTPCVIAEPRRELRAVFEARSLQVGAPFVFVDDEVHVDVDTMHPDLSMTVSVITRDDRFYVTTDLCGAHQARTVATVIACWPYLEQLLPRIPDDVLADEQRRAWYLPLAAVQQMTGLRGRIQLLQTDPPVILDVAHNPASMAALVQTLRACGYQEHSLNVVFGVMGDKDASVMIDILFPMVRQLYVCAPVYKRSMPTEGVAQIAAECNIPAITTHESVAAAVQAAVATHSPVLICGSFYVAEEALSYFRR
ncbi:folylpolyglutamate synthase/dihydrofolate synthase family protein [soil metagenome]